MPQPIMIGGMTLTQIYILLIVVLSSLFDVWMIVKYGREQSVSITFIDICRKNPELAFISGLIVGHIFLHIKNY